MLFNAMRIRANIKVKTMSTLIAHSYYRFLSSIALGGYGWEFRVAAFKRILELPSISMQDKKRMFDTLMQSLKTNDRTNRQARTTIQDLQNRLDF